jgi:ABC-type nitrate/sulfonate/bicarbonate transport system permease component
MIYAKKKTDIFCVCVHAGWRHACQHCQIPEYGAPSPISILREISRCSITFQHIYTHLVVGILVYFAKTLETYEMMR